MAWTLVAIMDKLDGKVCKNVVLQSWFSLMGEGAINLNTHSITISLFLYTGNSIQLVASVIDCLSIPQFKLLTDMPILSPVFFKFLTLYCRSLVQQFYLLRVRFIKFCISVCLLVKFNLIAVTLSDTGVWCWVRVAARQEE